MNLHLNFYLETIIVEIYRLISLWIFIHYKMYKTITIQMV